MATLPAPRTLLIELDRKPLSAESAALLRRARAFLYGISRPARHVAALMAGYTAETHVDGVYRLSILSGERPFSEWRQWRALRPPRDPDLPEAIAELARFATSWRERAVAATSDIAADDDRAEVLEILAAPEHPSATWNAKSTVQQLRAMEKSPWEPHRVIWAALVRAGIALELPAFDARLKEVQDFIARAPLDEAELADIHRARQDAAPTVSTWLDARRAQLASFSHDERVALGLAEEPPPPGLEPPLDLLSRFAAAARA
jgi:hypothetical protein